MGVIVERKGQFWEWLGHPIVTSVDFAMWLFPNYFGQDLLLMVYQVLLRLLLPTQSKQQSPHVQYLRLKHVCLAVSIICPPMLNNLLAAADDGRVVLYWVKIALFRGYLVNWSNTDQDQRDRLWCYFSFHNMHMSNVCSSFTVTTILFVTWNMNSK